MDLSVLLPPELLAAAQPESRAGPPFQARAGTESDAASAVLPFAFFLQQSSAMPLPAGEALPPTGKILPAATASSAVSLDLPPAIGSRQDWAAAPAQAARPPLDGAQGLGANVFDLPIETPAKLDAATAAVLAEAPHAAIAADDALPSPGAAPPAATQLDGAALDLDLPAAAGAPPAPPAADVAKPQSAAQVIAALAAAPAPAGGEPRPVLKTASAPPNVRNADAAARMSEPLAPFESELAAEAATVDAAQPSAVTEDAPLVPKPLERAAPLPSIGMTDAVSGTPSAAAHGLTTSPAQPAAGTPTAPSTQSQPPAHPHGGVDTAAARWNETLANRIHWLVDHDIGEARIKLNPAELGALDVTISMQDDKTYVQLTAHSASARDELTQSLPRLRELLTAHGLELGGATVSGGRDERPSHGPYAAPAVRTLDGVAPAALDDLPRAARGGSSQIDVFA